MSEQRFSIHNLSIEGASDEATEGTLHYYDVVGATTSLNAHSFSISKESLSGIAKQIREGRTPVYQGHRTYGVMPSGRVVSASLSGEKMRARMYIQSGIDSVSPPTDELIKLIDAGTVNQLSPTISGGKMICDQSGLEMKPKYDWFSFSYEDADGNRLGQIKRIDGKDVRITATLSGDVQIHELSVVGVGSIPDTEIIKKLQKEISEENISMDELPVIAELGNFNLNEFCTQLSVKPESIPLRRENKSMEKDKDLLERENDQLEKQVESLQTELAEKETALEDAITKEEYDTIVKERDELKEKQTELQELADNEKDLAEVGRIALKYAREEYVAAEVSLNSLNTDQEAEVAEYVSDKTDFVSLMRTAKSYRKRAAQNRSGGAKARTTYETPVATETKPAGYSRVGV